MNAADVDHLTSDADEGEDKIKEKGFIIEDSEEGVKIKKA